MIHRFFKAIYPGCFGIGMIGDRSRKGFGLSCFWVSLDLSGQWCFGRFCLLLLLDGQCLNDG